MEQSWLIAIGLFFVLEGLLPTLLPKAWKQVMAEIVKSSDSHIRLIGIIMMLLGLIWIYFVT